VAAVVPPALGEQIVSRCRELAGVSEEPGRLTRRYATPAMARCNAMVGAWMRDAGMTVRLDVAGNLVGRRPGTDPAAGTLLLGSHLDTVRDAGAFDGPLGVMTAIALVQRLQAERVALPFAIDVLGFADEEGLRFGTTYLGSRAVAGTFDDTLLGVVDDDGVSGVPVGVVTGIAGATRVEVRFRGQAGHAGTVPMALRRDAAPAVAELVLFAEALARGSGDGLLATVGRIDVRPGAPNVVAGEGIAFLDVRHAEDPARVSAVAALHERAEEIAAARELELLWDVRLDNRAVAVDAALTDRLSAAVTALGLPDMRLASGAGHDAVALSALCGVAMLFVRCAGGLSHHPAESVEAADAGVALDVLYDMVRGLAGA
jgi:allantoate deiminase